MEEGYAVVLSAFFALCVDVAIGMPTNAAHAIVKRNCKTNLQYGVDLPRYLINFRHGQCDPRESLGCMDDEY